MVVDQFQGKRSEWKRELRQQLQTAGPEEKRQLARTLFAEMLGAFGIRARADQLTWRKFWGRFGFLWTLLWIGYLLAFIVAGAVQSWFTNAIASTLLFIIFTLLGFRVVAASLRPFWLCLTGRMTQATVTSMHVEEGEFGPPRSTPIVTFATEGGEERSARLDERKERPLSDQLAREHPGDTSSRDGAPPPAIGTRMSIVYREGSDRTTQISIWSIIGGAMGLVCAAVVFGLAGHTALSILKTVRH